MPTAATSISTWPGPGAAPAASAISILVWRHQQGLRLFGWAGTVD